MDHPLEHGGSLQVTAHVASEGEPPDGSPSGSVMEWRSLRFKPENGSNNLVQSVTKVCMSPDVQPDHSHEQLQGNCLPLAYTKSFATIVLCTLGVLKAAVLPNSKESLRFLCIGLGGGSVPTCFSQSLPHCEVDVVELEPAVADAAVKGMGFNPNSRLRVFVDDGVDFALNAATEIAIKRLGAGDDFSDEGYDAVLVDAYDPDGNVPEALWSNEQEHGLCTALAKGLLKKRGGLVATNFLPDVALAPPLSAYAEALAKEKPGRGFSIQANKARDEADVGDVTRIVNEVEGTGNRIAVYMYGGPPNLVTMPLSSLSESLKEAAKEIGDAISCPWDMADWVSRGITDASEHLKESPPKRNKVLRGEAW
eukprot:TRINITY_DN64314_c0_g1_i1.p1 TRINITY_DN64314_c0_g1~~TRINITY_DN64314_c0_g1_i1.p1  ORF type:complete len:403 (+),score=75.08 TRINITY_DN64314_c0_g1_i1:113-1210(+)